MDLNSPAPRGSPAAPNSFLPPPAVDYSQRSDLPQVESLEDAFLLPQPVQPPPKSRAASTSSPLVEITSGSRPVAKPDDQNNDKLDWSEVLQGAPPWLGSMVFHMLLLIFMGLLVFNVVKKEEEPETIQAVYGEQLGQQLLEDNTGGLSTDKPDMNVDKTAFSPSDLPAVNDPFAAPPVVTDFSAHGMFAGSTKAIDAPIGLALTGRERGMKIALLGRYGGNATTEDSVFRALEWLKKNQRSTGLWSLNGPYTDGGDGDNNLSATAMALLAFQGAGFTPRFNADTKHDYKALIKKGWEALLKMQDGEGRFTQQGLPSSHGSYSHAQCTIALCELYGMTNDSQYRLPAERALQYCVKIQDAQGGWRYDPGQGSDTSVTGWYVMALQSALMAGLEVPSTTLQNVSRYLDHAQEEDGSRYQYMQGQYTNHAMTAEGLLCRQYLGWKQDDPRLKAGVEFLFTEPIGSKEINVYYWYYATQVMHHMGGDYWNRWNSVMRQYLPETQVKKGPEAGSWDPNADRWGPSGGRLYVTCLRTFMLEVYYRHLPIYSSIYQSSK